MKFTKLLIVVFLATFSLSSCSKEDPDTVGPAVEIINIEENQEFKFGENLVMYFKFTDQTGVNEYKYEIYAKDYTQKSFMYENEIKLESYYTELSEAQSVLLPEKSASESQNYQEGAYLIKVSAGDILGNLSIYYKTINIVYPEDEGGE
ncbi:MAG TPA: DUF4625 domain-containing protein [Flavobacterium sp.]|nr:DUF4625 domain-containing protein [Flavobacterium sp.]